MTWNHRGIDIEMTAGGYFTANIADVDLRSESLDGIKAKIDAEIASTPKRPVALAVIGITNGKTKVLKHTNVVAINRTTRGLMYSDKDLDLNFVIPDTPGNEALLSEYIEINAKQDRLYRAVIDLQFNSGSGYGLIEASEYEAYLRALEVSYAAKLAKVEANA